MVSQRIGYDAAGLSEVGNIGWVPGVEASEIRAVESVEEIQSDPECDWSSAEAREVLRQAHVDVPVREGSGYRESPPLEVGAETLASDIDAILPTQRHEAGILYPPKIGNVGNPVRDDALLLVVRRVLLDR